jgi:hypothetical protein
VRQRKQQLLPVTTAAAISVPYLLPLSTLLKLSLSLSLSFSPLCLTAFSYLSLSLSRSPPGLAAFLSLLSLPSLPFSLFTQATVGGSDTRKML